MKLSKRKYLLIALLLIVLFLILELLFRPQVLSQSLAETLYKMKNYSLPEKIFGHNADKADDLAAANLAKIKYRRGDHPEALKAAKDALDAKPGSASRNYDAGNSSYRKGDYEAAQDYYRKAMLKDPRDMDAKANYELSRKKLQKQAQPKPEPQKQPDKDEQKQEDIRNILGGLDSKESSDRKQDQGKGAAGGDKWW